LGSASAGPNFVAARWPAETALDLADVARTALVDLAVTVIVESVAEAEDSLGVHLQQALTGNDLIVRTHQRTRIYVRRDIRRDIGRPRQIEYHVA
jgi:hypothetical protein